MSARKKRKEPDFEEGLAALEAIVEEMEQGELPLEEAIARYEEGMELYKRSAAKLADARRRVELLLSADKDDVVTEDFPDVDPDPTR